MASVLPRPAALTALLLIAAAALGQTPAERGLGLCAPGSTSLDGYMRALCDGEAALQAGEFGTARERFSFAAALPRAEASNELAWAGLAVAHCHSREIDAGRQWAEHFSQARRLWLGELDCAASGGDPRARLSPFVRSRMCSDRLAADYAIVRGDPPAAHAIDLRARLQRIDDAVAATCAIDPAAPKPAKTSAAPAKAEGSTKASSKNSSRKTGSAVRSRKQVKTKSG